MKTIKYIIGTASIIIIILLIIPFFISLDTYKELLVSQVKKHTGRDLKIDGKISLDLLPTPQIKLTKLKLSSLPQAKTANLLEMEAVSGKLDLSPLLKGKIVISSIELVKPVINLEKLKNGKSTWEFQSTKTLDNSVPIKRKDNTQSQNATTAALPFIINDINIQKGILKYIDNYKVITIEDFDLNINIDDIHSPNVSTNLGASQLAGAHWSNQKIDLSNLTSANATIYLKIKKLTEGSLIFDNITVKSALEDGVLKIKSLTGGLYGGQVDGSCSISGKDNQPIELKLALKNAKIHNIVPEGRKIKVTSGIMDLTCDIKSQGFSQLSYVKNMHGRISLNGKDGKISGIDLHKLIQALNKPRDINAITQGIEGAVGKGETAFNALKSEISIEKGIMHINKCELISNETSAVAKGEINLPAFTLDAFATVNSGVKYLPPVTINFCGPLDNPQHKIDIRAIWEYLAKNALTGVIDNIKEGKIKPKDLLKGIIGGKETETLGNKSDQEEPPVQDTANDLLQKGIKGLFK